MIKCPQCGHQNSGSGIYCSRCGLNISSATAQLLPDTLLEGRYRIVKILGRGGMGAVYQALDLRLNNLPVAVKEMSTKAVGVGNLQEAIIAFKQEATILVSLRHPALPRITDFFSDESGRWYLVMDYIEGKTLQDIAKEKSPIPETEVLDWAKQICEVLDYLHNQNPPVIFRDLKPSNIMLTPEGEIKLIDFGIARHFKPGRTSDTLAYGSLGFSAPEQYGEGQTDTRSDIYSLGATLHFLLTGINPCLKPFNFTRPGELVTISTGLDLAIMKALEINPDQRPSSSKEMMTLVLGELEQDNCLTKVIKQQDVMQEDATIKLQLSENEEKLNIAQKLVSKFKDNKKAILFFLVIFLSMIVIVFASQDQRNLAINTDSNTPNASEETVSDNSLNVIPNQMTDDDILGIVSGAGNHIENSKIVHFPGSDKYYNVLSISQKNYSSGSSYYTYKNILCLCRFDNDLKRWVGIWQSEIKNGDSPWKSLVITEPSNNILLCADMYYVGATGSIECLVFTLEEDGLVTLRKSGALGHGEVELKDNTIIITQEGAGQSRLSVKNGKYNVEEILRSEMSSTSAVKVYFKILGDNIVPTNESVIKVKVGQTVAFIPSDENTNYEFNQKGTISIYSDAWNKPPLTLCEANRLKTGNSYTFLSVGEFHFYLHYLKGNNYPTGTAKPMFAFIVEQ